MDYLEFITRVISHIPDKGQVAFGGGTDFSLQNEFPIKMKGENWRFLSDHSSETAWSINPKGLMCPAYRIIPVVNSGKLSENLRNILPFKNWIYESEMLNNVPKIASRLMIISGFAKNEQLFKANSRPKEIIFFFV